MRSPQKRLLVFCALGVIGLGLKVVLANTDARMFRYPDVSATRIAFVYAGDIWTVPRAGGAATRITFSEGRGEFSAILARRQQDRVQRELRRQHRRVRRAGDRRRTGAVDLPPDGRPRGRLAPGWQAHPLCVHT
jgi:hypothetical protein